MGRPKLNRQCSLENCDKKHYGHGLCATHLAQQKRHGETWKIGSRRSTSGYLTPEGYRIVRVPQGHPMATADRKVLEHRLVMSEVIGRPLLPEENVHHKNGNRSDNRPENLELWVTKQPLGQRVEDKVRWAREILALYGDLVPEALNG